MTASSPLAHPSHHTPAESPQPSSASSVPPPGPPVARGRALTASGRTASSRSQTPVVLAPSNNSSPDRNIERKPSLSYGHHRQTSIVHGIGIQHSRNTSFVNSPATSPLSPLPLPVIAAGNGSPDGTAMTQASVTEAFTVAGVHVAAAGAGSTYSSAGPSIASTGSTPAYNAARKPERVQSGRRKEHHHQRSQSRHPQNTNEVRTMSEYAMTHLFHEFNIQADHKIAQCLSDRTQQDIYPERACGPGVDPAFDQLLSALGHIARHKPKSLIDTMMFWRKAKSEAAAEHRTRLANAKQAQVLPSSVLPRRNTEPLHVNSDGQPPASQPMAPERSILALQHVTWQYEQRSTISTYILCRVLIEIISQTDLQSLTQDMAERLLGIFYAQLNTVDPDEADESPLHHANWVMYVELLGVLSELIFDKIQDKFIADLRTLESQLSAKGQANRDLEGKKAALLVRSMRRLRVKPHPEEAWARTCDCMLSLAKLFANAHGQTLKYAYCQVLRELLQRIASKPAFDPNAPKWRTVVETMRPRLSLLLSKPKHWQEAFPLMVALLCVSPTETFLAQWSPLALSIQPRLKERATRAIALRGICQLVWTYIYRTTMDSPTTVVRKLEEIVRMVFQPGRRSYLSTDPPIAEPLIQLTRIIGFKYQDLCFKAIIFPLLNSEMFSSGRDLRVENMEPDRMVIGIRSFLAIMADLEKGERPPFPCTSDNECPSDSIELPAPPISPRGPQQLPIKSSLLKEERLSRPVNFSGFAEVAKEYYVRFCKILGEITIICDNAFGGQAVLDEKFSLQTPKTPMSEAFSFARRDDQGSADPRQGFYGLLHVAVQALPRCLSPHIPFNSLINLLCTGTAHVQKNIAASSVQSLKSIARQSHAQQVTIGFARFIFNFDDRYATMSDGGMLGPGHIESTLKLYVELLQIWIDEIKEKTRKAALDTPDDGMSGNRGVHLDLNSVWAHADEIESHGLFFLCSPSRRVRWYAVTVLRLITEFDKALGGSNPRIIRVMEGSPEKVMEISDEKLSLAERSRLQRGMRKSNVQSTLVELCSSDVPYDSTLWFKIFPNLVRISFEVCPFAVTLTRDIVCARLTQMHRTLHSLIDGPRGSPYPTFDSTFGKIGGRLASTSPEIVIEQWKLYLIFAFTTLTNLGSGQGNLRTQAMQHSRKSSKSSQKSANKVHTAGELFSKVLPFLSVDNAAVRDAAVIGLGSININLYRTLLEALQGHALACAEEAKTRLGMHTRTASSPRRNRRTDHLRTEITHVYKLTSHFLKMPEAYNDDWILNNVMNYTKDLRIFLSDAEVQNEWGFQKLRTHYCGLVEVLFEGINKTKDPLQWMPFQARKAAFTLMEDWCGYSANQQQIRQREENMRRSMLDRESDLGNKGIATAAMEIEKRDLRTAALSAMAALCGGPVSITTDSKVLLQFDVRRMLSWIDSIFETPSDRTHAIGRRALTNLIIHNREHPYLLDRAIEMCYLSKSSKSLESYFEVVTRVLTEREDYTLPFWKVLSAGLYTLGHENNEIRMKSARLLRTLEAREQKNSKLQDLDISISDKTIAVYKLAQFETSRRLAKQHSELAFMVFSQFSYYFKELQPDHQRNMVAAMLPWVQTVELQVNPEGGPTANSYMLLVNLFEITVRCSNALHNEIQALWQALATGPYAGNVQLILNFFINLCLDKREQNYVDIAKQIVVHLSSTPAGLKVVEFLLLHINPRSMVVEKREPSPPPPEAANLPYLADLDALLPSSGNKHSGFALGQICLILLVDLMVSPVQLASEHVPLLLQVVMVLWDHYIPVVQDQAREMLVHLIHELVISKIDDETVGIDKRAIEDFVESVRRHDPKVVWNYDDKSAKGMADSGSKVLESMSYVAGEVLRFFSLTYPGFREAWGKVTLNWATSCSVRHVACRSFQLFRCILSSLDQQMLADMLARLSNTVSDSESDIQTFSLEILTTLRAIIEALQPEDLIQYPQLFWATCACLDTIHEGEFMESMLMLDKLLDKIDLADPGILQILEDNRPDKWSGQFQGLSKLVYKGVRSSICLDRSLRLLERLVELPSSRIVGDHGRLVYTVLANMPRFLQSFDQSDKDINVSATANVLACVAEAYSCPDLFEALTAFANKRYRYDKDFVAQTMSAIRLAFFPEFEYESLVFLLSLLTNKLDWMKINTMEVLCFIIPEIDMRKPEITSKGSDLISPLLRLLHNEYCPQALKVLDSIMDMAGEANALENQHLRMSMAGGHSTRATRKQYAQTQSLYGIPEESGWSVPIPDHHAQLTRANVHAVFYTCGTVEENDATQVDTPKIEFRQEEILFSPTISDYRTATMTSEDTRGDSHIGELVMKLDSLDDFFEEDDDDTETLTDLPNSSMFGNNRYVNGSYTSVHPNLDARENLYDQRTAPILHKSLTRNASVSSFHYSSFADMELSPSRDPGVMTPGAFTSFASMAPAATSTRPGLHSRSVTSPSAPNAYQRHSPGLSSSAVYESDNAFSDDDLAAGRSSSSNPSEKAPSFEHVVRPPVRHMDARSRFRSGMRRLTGGGGDAKEREKTREAIKMALQKSPQVPKVPDIYLVNPKSADP